MCYDRGMRALLVVAVVLSARTAHADEPAITCRQADPNSKLVASFKPDIALQDLVVWVAGFTCKNIVVAPDVAKYATKLTVVAPKAMSPRQALQLFVDAVESTGLVVQQKPDTIVIKLGPNMPKNCPGTVAPAGPPPKGGDLVNPFSPRAELPEDEFQKAIDAGIKKLDDTHYEIAKSLLAKVVENPMAFMKGARVIPAMKDGKSDGIKLYAIRPSSPYARLGLTNGDTIVSINGLRLDSTEKALDIYTKLRQATKLEVGVVRRGKPLTMTYVIK